MKTFFKLPFAIILAAFLFGISNPVIAQKSIQEIATLPDKKWDKLVLNYKENNVWVDPLKVLISEGLVDESNLPNPKKIGVLTMQIWDKSITTSTKIANTMYYEKNFLTPSGSNMVADRFLQEMLPVFSQSFQEKGITLLEPNEYLTDDEKKKIYKEGVNRVEMSGLSKALRNGFTRLMTGNVKGEGSLSATGYEFYPLSASIVATDFKAPSSIGLIAEELGLDAVLILTVNISLVKNGKSLVLHGIESALVGPIDDDTSIEYKGRIGAGMMNKYRDGLPYSSVYFAIEKPFEVAALNKKGGQISAWYLDGLNVVTSRMANDLIIGMEKFIALDKSKN
nr:hypothetical protein [uncultured Draconibacterium sp.]